MERRSFFGGVAAFLGGLLLPSMGSAKPTFPRPKDWAFADGMMFKELTPDEIRDYRKWCAETGGQPTPPGIYECLNRMPDWGEWWYCYLNLDEYCYALGKSPWVVTSR